MTADYAVRRRSEQKRWRTINIWLIADRMAVIYSVSMERLDLNFMVIIIMVKISLSDTDWLKRL